MDEPDMSKNGSELVTNETPQQQRGRKKMKKTKQPNIKSKRKTTAKPKGMAKIDDFCSPKRDSVSKADEKSLDLKLDLTLDITHVDHKVVKEEFSKVSSSQKPMKIQPIHVCNSSSAIVTQTVGYLKMSPYCNRQRRVSDDGDGVCGDDRSPESESDKQPTNNKSTSKRAHATPLKNIKNKKCAKPVESQKLTDFFPIRRSSRKTKSMIKKENEDKLIDAILSNKEDDLEIVEFSNKGRGVIATRNFSQGEFVVEYAGDFISWPEAKERELEYALDSTIGCYMYYFSAKGQNFCIDATAESGRLGRLLNHSRRNPNCHTRLVWVPNEKIGKQRPHLVILAKRDIKKDEELMYDYGDRDKSALEVHPWLKS